MFIRSPLAFIVILYTYYNFIMLYLSTSITGIFHFYYRHIPFLSQLLYFHSELSDSMGIIQQVENGRLDFGLVGMTTDSSELIFIPFLEDELVIVTPVTPITWRFPKKCNHLHFLNEPFILREKVPVQKKPSTSILNSSVLHREPSML